MTFQIESYYIFILQFRLTILSVIEDKDPASLSQGHTDKERKNLQRKQGQVCYTLCAQHSQLKGSCLQRYCLADGGWLLYSCCCLHPWRAADNFLGNYRSRGGEAVSYRGHRGQMLPCVQREVLRAVRGNVCNDSYGVERDVTSNL